MAGPYYVDISAPAAWNGKTGLDKTTNCLLGFTGLQKAVDTAVNGEVVYIKGSESDLSKFYSVAYDADNNTSLTDGEECTWGTDAAHGHGVVHIISTTATSPGTVEIEVISGAIPANDLDITGVTSGGVITPTAAISQKGIDFDTNAGTNAGGYIKYIGCKDDADFTVTGLAVDRVIIDAHESALGGSLGIVSLVGTPDLTWLENIEVMDCHGSNKHGFALSYSGSNNQAVVLINCCAHECSGSGISNGASVYCFLFRCVAYLNSDRGITCTSSRMFFCCARDNAGNGFGGSTEAIFIGCVSHGNGNNGVALTLSSIAYNCVIDGNSDNGILVTAGTTLYTALVLGCRITNHTQTGTDSGLDCNSENVIFGYNYFEDNGDDPANNVINDTIAQILGDGATSWVPGSTTPADTNLYGLTNTSEGYVDKANHNFATGYTDAGDPDLRRQAITIPWT